MTILNKKEARAILEKVIALSKADGCEANLEGSNSGNIRYARNSVSTAGVTEDISLVVQCNFGKKVGTATINEFDDASLAKVVARAEETARLAPESPEFMPVLGPQKYAESDAFVTATAAIKPQYRAKAAAASIGPARENGATAAGFLNDSASFSAMMNSEGLFAYHTSTNVNFTVTVRSNDGTGSGWASSDDNDVRRLDVAQTSGVALQKALQSREAKALEPGKYTVILEPNAAAQLIGRMFFSFGARQADEGRSFLAKKGGGTRLGEQVFDERVSVYGDPLDKRVPVGTWNQSGEPVGKLDIIKNGVVENLFYSRYWADFKGVDSVPQPNNLIMVGGDKTQEELIKNTERGILVSRLWYIRALDPQTQLYTGLTRDGTFYIEDGEIKFPVKNFRFNESPVIMLNNLEELGKGERVSVFGFPVVMPSMKVREFTFSSLSDAV
ncbi:MAG: TldD/PmbA family protein [Pseudomonadota bacterium]